MWVILYLLKSMFQCKLFAKQSLVLCMSVAKLWRCENTLTSGAGKALVCELLGSAEATWDVSAPCEFCSSPGAGWLCNWDSPVQCVLLSQLFPFRAIHENVWGLRSVLWRGFLSHGPLLSSATPATGLDLGLTRAVWLQVVVQSSCRKAAPDGGLT